MKPTLTPAQIKAAKLYQNPDNSLSYIAMACGIGNNTIYAALDALCIPRRDTKRTLRQKMSRRRASLTSQRGL